MVKFIFKLICVIIIVFLSVPFIASLGTDKPYTLPLRGDSVILKMPDGEMSSVSMDEYLMGSAAAFVQSETDAEVLRAAYVLLNTPELVSDGVLYLSREERTILWGDEYSEKSALHREAMDAVCGQSIVPASGSDISLFECMDSLSTFEGGYTERLAQLFPGGGLKTEK